MPAAQGFLDVHVDGQSGWCIDHSGYQHPRFGWRVLV
jgi:hypothetical protein